MPYLRSSEMMFDIAGRRCGNELIVGIVMRYDAKSNRICRSCHRPTGTRLPHCNVCHGVARSEKRMRKEAKLLAEEKDAEVNADDLPNGSSLWEVPALKVNVRLDGGVSVVVAESAESRNTSDVSGGLFMYLCPSSSR